MTITVEDDLTHIHATLVAAIKERPEYQDGQESAVYGYSEGVEHAVLTMGALGYEKIRVISDFEELASTPLGSTIITGGKPYQVRESPRGAGPRLWVGPGWGDEFRETADQVASRLPARLYPPLSAAAEPAAK